MEEMVPAPAPREPRAQRYSAVSWAPTMLLLFNPIRPQVKLRSPLQSSGQVSEHFPFSAYFPLISRHPDVFIRLCFYKWNSLCLSDIGYILKIGPRSQLLCSCSQMGLVMSVVETSACSLRANGDTFLGSYPALPLWVVITKGFSQSTQLQPRPTEHVFHDLHTEVISGVLGERQLEPQGKLGRQRVCEG